VSTIDSLRKHVHHLSVDIGPRGSTTPEEKRAAAYAEDIYKGLDLTPITEIFAGAKSAWSPFTISTFLVLVAEIVFLFGGLYGAVIASLVTAFVLASLILELSFKSNPLRWILPKGLSQNVSVAVEPASEIKQTIVIVGHIDTHRTPISHRSLRWFSIFNRLTTLTFVSAILLLLIFGVQIFIAFEILRLITIILCIPVLAIFLMAISADFTPYSFGANDNASGAALTMALAEKLAKEQKLFCKIALMGSADAKANAEIMEEYKVLIDKGQEFIKKYGLTSHDKIRDAAIKFCLSNPDVHSVCPTLNSFEDLEAFTALSGTRLDAEGNAMLADYESGLGRYYCRHACGHCEGSCPQGIPVNTIMRYFHYFAAQGREKYAMEKYSALSRNRADFCADCTESSCEKACPYGVLTRPLLAVAHHNLSFDNPLYT